MKRIELVRKRIFAAALSVAVVAAAVPEMASAETAAGNENSVSYTDEAYIEVLSKVVGTESVSLEADTDINRYGLGTVTARLNSSSGEEVTDSTISWSSSDSSVIQFYDSVNNAFVDSITTENADSVQFYGLKNGTATITAKTNDGVEATTESITVEGAKSEWNSTVAGVLVHTDTQSGKVGAFNGMVIDTATRNGENGKSGKCGMKAGAAKGMQIRNTILSIPASEDAKITVKLYQAPSAVATEDDGSLAIEGLLADGRKVKWDAEECAYIVGFDMETQAVKAADMQVSPSDISTGDGSVKEFADSYAQLVFGSSDVYVTSITVETGDGISYDYNSSEESQSENEKESTEEASEEPTETPTEEASDEPTETPTEEASEESTETTSEETEESTEESSEESSEESTEEAEAVTTDIWDILNESEVTGLSGTITEDIILKGASGNLELTLSAEGTDVGNSKSGNPAFAYKANDGLKIKRDALKISGVSGKVRLEIEFKNTGGSSRDLEVTVGADGTTETYNTAAKDTYTYSKEIDADNTDIYIGASNELAVRTIKIEAADSSEDEITTSSIDDEISAASTGDEILTASAEGVADAYIALEFDGEPELAKSSNLAAHIYNASTGQEVDTVYANEGESAAEATYYTGSSSTTGVIGKIAVKDNLIAVEGNTLVITPHNDENGYPILENGTKYYVTLDEGLVSGKINGKSVSSVNDKTTFTFGTSDVQEINDGTIDVNHDGSGDFYTINGALNFLRKSEAAGEWAINVAEGTYHERLFYSGAADITLDGADGELGDKVRVDWKNVDDYGSGGARSRATFLVQGTGDMTIKDMSFDNSYSRTEDGDDGSTQAETLSFDSSGKLIAYNSSFISHQDTLYIGKKGTRAWFYNDYIEGDVDYIWGYADTALFENCKLKCVADEKSQSYIFASRTYTDQEANKGFVLLNSEVEIPAGMTASFARNSGSDTQASIINNSFSGEGSLNTALYGSAPNEYVTDAADDLAIGYKDYNNTMNGELVDTSKRLDKCGEFTERVVNREYNGRFVILNRGFDKTDERYETASEKWDLSSYEKEFGAAEDISEGNIFLEPVAVKKLVGGNTVKLSVTDIDGNDISDKVKWSYVEEKEGIVASAENGLFTSTEGSEGLVSVKVSYERSTTPSEESGESSESSESGEATEEPVEDDSKDEDSTSKNSVSYNGRSCLEDGAVLDGVTIVNNAVNGYMVSENLAAGSLALNVNFYDGMAYRNGATVPTVVALNGTVIYEDGNLVKNAEIAPGVVVKRVKFTDNKNAFLKDDSSYQGKSGKAPRIVVKLAAKDRSAKSIAKAAEKVLRNSSALEYEIEPVDVAKVIAGDSIYSGYSFSLKNGKIRFKMPKYKNGTLVSGKSRIKTLTGSDFTRNSDGTYNFLRNFKGTNISIN